MEKQKVYFGDEARDRLDALYEDYRRVGNLVETAVRRAQAVGSIAELDDQTTRGLVGREQGSLNDRVYRFGLMLMGQLRDGMVGRYAPPKSRST